MSLILLNVNVGSLSFSSLSMYDNLFTEETNFVAPNMGNGEECQRTDWAVGSFIDS